MKKLILIAIIFIQLSLFSQFSGGSGTVLDPYQIATAEDLDNIRNYLEDSFIQTADIDLGIAPWNEGEGWEPIGDYDWTDPTKSFRGNYDGDGYEITNMYINRPLPTCNGVFGSSDGAKFKNMRVIDFSINGLGYCGGVSGISYNDMVRNCIATGNIIGQSDLGLLMGFFEGYSIKDCHVKGEINAAGGWAGGLIGTTSADSIVNCTSEVIIISDGVLTGGLLCLSVNTGVIEYCYSISNIVTTNIFTGGFIGDIDHAVSVSTTINNCFSVGKINSTSDQVGGFIGGVSLSEGFDYNLIISNCFSKVDVTGNDKIGGFIGDLDEITVINNCYSSGSVSGSSKVGGFVGSIDSLNTVSVSNSYWDTDTSGLLATAGNLGEGRTTVEMTDPHAGNTYTDWDFTDIWVEDTEFHNEGYPFLGWHDTSIDNNYELLTMNYELEQNYPNPFNNQTNIGYTLEDMGKVEISVYNGNGQFVSEVVNRVVNAGMHSATFNADKLNSGIYYYQFKIDGMVKETKKMLYLR
jgi:hypothetical protein